MTWCSEVLSSALARTSASAGNDRSKRRKKHASQTQETSLNDRTLEIAKVRMYVHTGASVWVGQLAGYEHALHSHATKLCTEVK